MCISFLVFLSPTSISFSSFVHLNGNANVNGMNNFSSQIEAFCCSRTSYGLFAFCFLLDFVYLNDNFGTNGNEKRNSSGVQRFVFHRPLLKIFIWFFTVPKPEPCQNKKKTRKRNIKYRRYCLCKYSICGYILWSSFFCLHKTRMDLYRPFLTLLFTWTMKKVIVAGWSLDDVIDIGHKFCNDDSFLKDNELLRRAYVRE